MWLLNLDLNQGQTPVFIRVQSVALATERLIRLAIGLVSLNSR